MYVNVNVPKTATMIKIIAYSGCSNVWVGRCKPDNKLRYIVMLVVSGARLLL